MRKSLRINEGKDEEVHFVSREWEELLRQKIRFHYGLTEEQMEEFRQRPIYASEFSYLIDLGYEKEGATALPRSAALQAENPRCVIWLKVNVSVHWCNDKRSGETSWERWKKRWKIGSVLVSFWTPCYN